MLVSMNFLESEGFFRRSFEKKKLNFIFFAGGRFFCEGELHRKALNDNDM
jgi:hypothetical protein